MCPLPMVFLKVIRGWCCSVGGSWLFPLFAVIECLITLSHMLHLQQNTGESSYIEEHLLGSGFRMMLHQITVFSSDKQTFDWLINERFPTVFWGEFQFHAWLKSESKNCKGLRHRCTGAPTAVARFPCREASAQLRLALNGTIPHFDSSLHPLLADHPTILELRNKSLAYF